MLFSSPLFLFLFLPIVLALAFLPGLKLRNTILLFASIVFYAWGEVVFVLLMLGSAVLNYFLGRWVDAETQPSRRKWAVAVAVILNIGMLAYFKYANFAIDNLNPLLAHFHVAPIHINPVRLPIGISFFTFHALSYVIDIYRRKQAAAKDPRDTALYIFFFPQLIAGPILRWSAIAPQLAHRIVTREGFVDGIHRFVGGLAKKMLIANAVALPADKIFALPANELTPAIAWMGAICYTVQIYFDFSAYSDMAVGLGKMFGFTFLENFNFPYIAESLRDFWRRWHISLSSWFRDYLYIPLGGNRCPAWRNHLNLVIVFFLCGLWHGASWTFAVWGLFHGCFLVLERTPFGTLIDKSPRPLRHVYTLLAVIVGWVLFRADTFAQAITFLTSMCGISSAASHQTIARFLDRQVLLALIFGVIFSMPIWAWISGKARQLHARVPEPLQPAALTAGMTLRLLLVVAALLMSAAWMAGGTYNPFIYFRF
jgi:alginate O-acetyltransferase complex protein AlgI